MNDDGLAFLVKSVMGIKNIFVQAAPCVQSRRDGPFACHHNTLSPGAHINWKTIALFIFTFNMPANDITDVRSLLSHQPGAIVNHSTGLLSSLARDSRVPFTTQPSVRDRIRVVESADECNNSQAKCDPATHMKVKAQRLQKKPDEL